MSISKMLSVCAGVSTNVIDFVGSATFAGNGSVAPSVSLTSLTGGISSAAAEGDLVVVFYAATYQPYTYSFNNGFTKIGQVNTSVTYEVTLMSGYKLMTATPDTSVSVNHNSPSSHAMVAMVFRNVDQTTPLDATPTSATDIVTCLADPPSITPVTDFSVVVSCGAGNNFLGTSGDTYSSSDLDNFVSVANKNGSDCCIIGSGIINPASTVATNPSVFGLNGTDDTAASWAAYTIAIRPQ